MMLHERKVVNISDVQQTMNHREVSSVLFLHFKMVDSVCKALKAQNINVQWESMLDLHFS